MTREEAKELLPIVKALAEGKMIQGSTDGSKWFDTDEINLEYEGQKIKHRIKPEPRYRPFKTKKECWNEILKHQPLGWVTSPLSGSLYLIESVLDGVCYNNIFTSYEEAFVWIKFVDGTPFGIKEEYHIYSI